MDGAGAGFGGVAIWNELIDGVDQFLDIVDFLGINCYADSFAHNPVLGALFGLTGNRKFLDIIKKDQTSVANIKLF